ncbi:transcriptional regulator [Streptomyces sp. V2]|uniref:helix-turn-helix domain-containing protein n=1 Tax=Streptomyces sp. V2 TaxID=1424099 RepID=UPI000D66B1AC|nr:helix-turn-helix transcriptional regulator [Streptomyces sp. V2]PWG09624.1 transcriptional regulator [Streptomyces sp. V2]
MAKQKDLDLPTSPRVFLGRELRHAREEKGYSQTGLGEVLFVSGSYVGQMEVGIRRIRPEMGPPLDKALGTGTFFTRNSKELAKKSKYPEHFEEAAEAEAKATEIRHYLPLLIPGLLQTPEYAESLFRTYRPTASDDEIEELVALRMGRTRLLDGPTNPLFWVVLDEAVIRRPVGGPAVMAAALRHVMDVAQRRRVILQVLPFSSGTHAGMGGSLKLMAFKDASPLCFTEGLDMGKLEDDPAVITRHTLTFNLLQADALPTPRSLALIESVAQDYAHEAQHL